jgi:hypothetical protein
MKRKEAWIFGILFIIIFINFASAETNAGSMIVNTDVQAETISIEVNSSIDFGTIAKGYKSSEQKIEVINKGNVEINITPKLDTAYTGEIFKYLYFQRIKNDPLKKIGEFSISIDKPSELGETEKETMYVLLDLKNYAESINSAMTDHNTKVIFWATKV